MKTVTSTFLTWKHFPLFRFLRYRNDDAVFEADDMFRYVCSNYYRVGDNMGLNPHPGAFGLSKDTTLVIKTIINCDTLQLHQTKRYKV